MDPNPNSQPSDDNRSSQPPVVPNPMVIQPTALPNQPPMSAAGPATPTDPVAGPGLPPQPVGPFAAPPQQPLTNLPLPTPQPSKSKKKKLLIIGAIVMALLLIAAAAYAFLVYIPNRPQNVWNTGMNRTGETLAQLVNSATEESKLQSFEKAQVTGSVDIDSADAAGSAALAAKYDNKGFEGGLDVNLEGSESDSALNVSAKAKGGVKDGAQYPDVHFQLNGMTELGLDGLLPGIGEYDGRWITIGSDMIEAAVNSTAQLDQESAGPTAGQVAELTKSVVNTATEYIFSSEADKAVINQQSYVGKEESAEGITALHYKATVNKTNAKKFCGALVENVYATDAFNALADESEKTPEAKQESITSCQDSVEADIDAADTFDIWIDSKYKLLHKVRISDPENQDKYVDIGQSYTGGDEIPFFVNYRDSTDSKGTVSFAHVLNMKTYKSTGSVTAEVEGVAVKGTYTVAPYNGTVDGSQPNNSVPVEQVLERLGIDPNAIGF